MIRHAITLHHVARTLHDMLRNAVLVNAYSPEKFVCLLVFETQHGLVQVYASVDPTWGRLSVRPATSMPRRNLVHVFQSSIGETCSTVTKHPDDRIVSFWLSQHVIHVMAFGGGTGNVVRTRDGVVVDALRRSAGIVGTPLQVNSSGVPPLGRYYEAESEHNPEIQERLVSSQSYYVLEKNDSVVFSVLPLAGYTPVHTSTDIFSAIEETVRLRRHRTTLEQLRKRTLADLSKKLQQLTRTITKLEAAPAGTVQAQRLRHEADVLMAQPNVQAAGLHKLAVSDWNGESIVLELDHRKSIRENAVARYERAKNAERAGVDRSIRLPQLQQVRNEIEEQMASAEVATSVRDLELHTRRTQKGTGKSQPENPFRTFQLQEGWTVYVGRNAKNNDELTTAFAKPQDWWLHTRGVQGAHVVLRCTRTGERPPPHIIDQTASIAAYYSPARNSAWVPVILTQKKWVRKPRRAAPGAVVVEREEVVLAAPTLPPTSRELSTSDDPHS